VHAGVGDRDQALDKARRDLFSYAVVDAYAANFTRAGFADEVTEIRDRHHAGDRDGALAAVSDRMCDAIDVVGSAELVAATVRDYAAAGVDVPVLMPLPWGGDRTQVIADTLRAAARA
jgi:alkanesulfonate monooxygenase SsuD/methylene tetrahydromethanopterin reductase-like flavin-dependent oxidoreductase (luciferase family)